MPPTARRSTAETTVAVALGDLTEQQLLIAVFRKIEGLEKTMGTLKEAVAENTAAVDTTLTRLLGKLEDAQARLSEALADDQADADALRTSQEQAQALLAEATDAVTSLRESTAKLNQAGADEPDPVDPVEPNPTDPNPTDSAPVDPETPVDPAAPTDENPVPPAA